MKTKYIVPVLVSAGMLILSACGGSSDLEKKKAKLDKLKSEMSSLQGEIAALEAEIAELDSSSDLRVKLVSVDTITKQKFEHFIEVQGNMDSDDNILVSPEMPGVITSVFVKEGDKVGPGTVLASIDAATIQSQLAQVQAAYDLAKTTFEKQERLWNQKIGSEIQYLQAKANKESTESQLKAIQAQLSMTRLKSPISGTVDAVMVRPGEMASPGMNGVRVVNLSKMKVVARVSDQYLKNLKKGAPVEIEIPDLDTVFTSKISFVGQVINPGTRSVDVEVQLANKNNVLKPNMVVRIRILDQVAEEVVVVPTNLLQNAPDGKFVMVVAEENGKPVARKRMVEAGEDYNGKSVVTSGLEPGDLLITFGYSEVMDGQAINY